MTRLIFLLIFVLALLLGGCAQKLVVKVDSIAADDAGLGKSYVLRSSVANVTEDDLYFREFSAYMHRILDQRGFRQVGEGADLVIYFNYGTTAGETQYYTTATPIYDWTGGEIVTYTETKTETGGKVTRKAGQTTLPMRERIVGYDRIQHSYTPYTSHITLEARDAATNRPLWKTTVTAVGESTDDLRRMMPVLAESAAPWLARDTGGRYEVKIDPKTLRPISGP